MPDTSVLTLGEAAAFLPGIRGDERTVILDIYRGAVSDRLDELCGAIVKRAVTEIHDPGPRIVLRDRPYAGTVTSMSTRVGTTTTTVDVSGVVVDPSGIVDWPWHFIGGVEPSSVTVVYEAGRYADTAAVGSRFKLAAGRLLQAWWRPAEGAGSQTFPDVPDFTTSAVPDDVLGILGDEVRPPVVA